MNTILVLTSTYPRWRGDIEPGFVHLLNQQLSRHYRIIVLAPHYPGARRHETIDGIEIHRFRYFLPSGEHLAYNGGIIANLKKNRLKLLLVPFFLTAQLVHITLLCRKNDISLIHAHWVIPQGLLAVFSRQARLIPRQIKIISTSHGGDLFSFKGGLLQKIKRYVFNMSNHVTVVSNAMKQHLQKMGWKTEHVTVQPMGVDLVERFTPDPTARIETDLVFIGRLVEKKGVITLLEAIAILRNEYPSLRLRIIGDGPEKPGLQHQARDLGIEKQIDFVGAVENTLVPIFYRSARIAVVPSVIARDGDQEGLGLVAVEALGCGCATVVSDLPALRDVVLDGETGLVFQSGNPRDLSDKIKRLLTDKALLTRLGQNGRNYVMRYFDWQHVGIGYAQLVRNCLSS